MNKSFTIRKERYESQIKKIVSKSLFTEIYDNDIKLANILDVTLNNDLSIAKIYISTFNKDDTDTVLKKINNAKSFFRKILANELKLRKVPEVIFLKDESSERFDEVERILKEI